MDWPTFTVEIVKALAWPIVAVVVIIVFHKKLTELLEQITEFKAWGAEAKFAKKTKEALVEAKEIEAIEQPPPLPPEPAEPVPPPFDPNAPVEDRYLARIEPINKSMLAASPTGAMLVARRNLEAAVKRLCAREGVLVPGPSINLRKAIEALKDQDIISPRTYASAVNLMKLGNEASHGHSELSQEVAASYINAVEAIIQVMLAPRKKD